MLQNVSGFIGLGTLAVALLTGCTRESTGQNQAGDGSKHQGSHPLPEAVIASAETKGKAIVAQAFSSLSSNLMQATSVGGITNALPYCSIQAQPLTRAVAQSNRVELRRITHKARNPSNKATAAELAILQQFQSDLAGGQMPGSRVIENPAGGVTFYAPIVLNNPLCLNCHGQPGQDIRPEHLALIQQLYPKDEATGFKFGELRGMWRVDFEEAELAQ